MKKIILFLTIIFFMTSCQNPKFFGNKQTCDKECLASLLENHEYKEFVDNFDEKFASLEQIEIYKKIKDKSYFDEKIIKLAVILPQKSLKSYSVLVPRAILSYVTNSKFQSEVKFYYIKNENAKNIKYALDNIKKDKIKNIIAPLGLEGFNNVLKNDFKNFSFYFPNINKNQLSSKYYYKNFVFGGIDYKNQINLLQSICSKNKIVVYEDEEFFVNLNKNFKDSKFFKTSFFEEKITKNKQNKKQIPNKLRNFTKEYCVFLNAPIIKSAFVSEVMRQNKIKVKAFLSPQFNYDSAILKLFPKDEQDKLFLASYIYKNDENLQSYYKLLGFDLDFEMFIYSSLIGIDYFYEKENLYFKSKFKEKIIDNQVSYYDKVLKINNCKFINFI